MDDPGTNEGQRSPGAHRLLNGAGCAGLAVTTSARPAGPREHGRQAARSKRDRTERAGEQGDELSHVRAAAGGVLIIVEANSAMTNCNSACHLE